MRRWSVINHVSPPVILVQPQPFLPTEDPDRLLHGPNMINETPLHIKRPSKESLAEKARKMVLRTEELEGIDRRKVKNHEDEFIENEILDSYGSQEEPSAVPSRESYASLEMENWRSHWETSWSPPLEWLRDASLWELLKKRTKRHSR